MPVLQHRCLLLALLPSAHLNTFLSPLDSRGRRCCCTRLSGKLSSATHGLQHSLHEVDQSHLLHLAWSTAICPRAKAVMNERPNNTLRGSNTCKTVGKPTHDQRLAMRCTGRPVRVSTPAASCNSPNYSMLGMWPTQALENVLKALNALTLCRRTSNRAEPARAD